MSNTIPLHPFYVNNKGEKPFLELQSQLPKIIDRILELEKSVPIASPIKMAEKNTNHLSKRDKSNEQPI